MKALIVITKAGIGGAQTFVSVLAKGLKRLGADVCVLTGEGGELTEGLDREKIPSFFCPHLRRSGNPVAAIRFVIALRKIIDEQAINVLHLNSSNALPGVWAAILSRSKPKTVFTVHGLSVLDANYRASAIVKRLYLAYYRFFFRYVDQVVFVSKYNQEEAGKIGLGQRSTVIYNGLDLASDHFLGRAEARRRLGEMAGVDLTDAFIIGSVGRLSRQKNYNFLIGVWPEIK